MKRKASFLALPVFVAILIVAGLLYGHKPFAKLKASEVVSATLDTNPAGKVVEIKDTDTLAELVAILRSVRLYGQGEQSPQTAGRLMRFTLTLRDGTEIRVGEYSPFLYVNEVCYKTRIGPLGRLGAFGDRLLEAMHA